MSDLPPPPKPRIHVRAPTPEHPGGEQMVRTSDNIVNFAARIGLGAGNQLSATFNNYMPVSRLSQLLDWSYRSSWVVGAAVDVISDDMTRAGIMMNSATPPDQIEQISKAMHDLDLWNTLNQTLKWSRLYGGAILVLSIDGQDPATPLIPERVLEGALKGFQVFDRWQLQPSFSQLIDTLGPDYGLPVYYDVVQTQPFLPRHRIHYSRVLRFDGVNLPFRQRLAENGWGMSVIERIYDRLLAFDSGTLGAAQLLYKAYLRTYKVAGYRDLIGVGGELEQRFHRSMDLMRMLQSNEGMTVIDKEDEFETHSYTFSGIPETLMVLGQQISGALGIPLVRLFGQSPAGLNATGESDWKLYEAMIRATQEARLRRPLTRLFEVLWQSTLGQAPPETWSFSFRSIDEPNEIERAEIAATDTATIVAAHNAGIIPTSTALEELQQSSILTGRWTNISEEMIKDAESQPPPWEPPSPEELLAQGFTPGGAAKPGQPGQGGKPGAQGGGAGGAVGVIRNLRPPPPKPPRPASDADPFTAAPGATLDGESLESA